MAAQTLMRALLARLFIHALIPEAFGTPCTGAAKLVHRTRCIRCKSFFQWSPQEHFVYEWLT
jgi:hypothetical protein